MPYAGGTLDQPYVLWTRANYVGAVWQLLEKSQQQGFKITDLTAGEVELNKEITKVINRISAEGW